MALSVSRSGYYQWAETEQSLRAETNAALSKEIERVYHEHKGRYGSPRITQQLRQEGVVCGENRVARLMRENEASCSRQEGVSAAHYLAWPGSNAQPDQGAPTQRPRSDLGQ